MTAVLALVLVLLSGCTSGGTDDQSLPSAADYVYLRGVNTQGGGGANEDPGRVPGEAETDYHWNSQEFYDYVQSRGHKIVRLDFLWERVQPELGGELDRSGLAELERTVQRAADAGLLVLLDMKNYGRYWLPDDTQVMLGDGITEEDFAGVWRQLADAFADQPAVAGFGLMNEPWGLPDPPGGEGDTSVWKEFSQAAVDAIRDTGETRSIFVAGDEWGGAWGWSDINGDPWIDDPADNVIYEAHVYFDANNSGKYDSSYADTEADAVERGWPDLSSRIEEELENFTGWLKEHGERGFIGEIGWPSGPEAEQWNEIGELAYGIMNEAEVGATYWAAGEWLSTDGGMYNQDAYNRDRQEPQAQVAVIEAEDNLSKRR